MKEQQEPFSNVPRMSLPNVSRRTLLVGGGLAAAGVVLTYQVQEMLKGRGSVFIAKNQRYDGPLEQTIRDGFLAAWPRRI